MREVDFWSHFTLGGSLLVILAGGVVAGFGIFTVVAIAALIMWLSSTAMTAGIFAAIASTAISCTLPGLVVSSPGIVVAGAILWGRLRSRWSHVKWQEFREDDVVEERRRLEEVDRLRRERVESTSDRRRATLEAVSRSSDEGG